jgi:hypothetical protein
VNGSGEERGHRRTGLPAHRLTAFYLSDPRVVVIPPEHLSPSGMSRDHARLLAECGGWSAERVALFDGAFSLYWERTAALARRTRGWAPPRLRHVVVVGDPLAVRPYAQLLNTTGWTLYECDLDPERSSFEFLAYLLVQGDRMALLGEVTMAAVHNAAYWFERGATERAAFATAAERSTRPDAAAFGALARATEWLRLLAHETLRPPPAADGHRPVPGTGLLVPARLEKEPPALVGVWDDVARGALAAFRDRWRRPDRRAVAELGDWLAAAKPPLLVTARGPRVVWDPERSESLGPLCAVLRQASGAAVRDVGADLRAIADATRAFLDATVAPDELRAVAADMDRGGYTFLDPARRFLVYDLDAPELERLKAPSLPFARAMLGARALHEWAHLGAAAGWVPRTLGDADTARLLGELADALDASLAHAPSEVRRRTAEDLRQLLDADRAARPLAERDDRRLVSGSSAGAALARTLLTRMPDYQANLLAARFWSDEQAEVYVRHNVRTLRGHYEPGRVWRMLVRYLYEYQYLRFSAVGDARRYFLSSTWFDADFIETRILDEGDFDRLASLVAALCSAYAVDETRFHFAAGRSMPLVGSP